MAARRVSVDPTVVPVRRGLSDARRYTPRGRTVREAAAGRGGRTGDPFRPALEVVSGGGRSKGSSGTAGAGRTTGKAAGTTTGKAAGRTTGKTAGDRRDRDPAGGRRRAPTRRAPARVPQQRRAPARRPVRRPVRPPGLGEPRRRLRVATLLVFALFSVIAIRLVQLQLTDAQAYAAAGLQDRLHRVVLAAPRGAIYDRNGEVLARSVAANYVYADPGMVEDPAAAAAKLSPLLGMAPSELLPKLTAHNRPGGGPSRFEWLARGMDLAVGDAVRELNIKGVGVGDDERREVPGHDLAANLLGFTGDDMHGLEGLEARFDDLLYGTNGQWEFEIGQGDLAAPIPHGYSRQTPARPGSSLQLTVDADLQFKIQQILANTLRPVAASVGTAVVLDIQTGEVLAQASYPGYDAADPLKAPPAQRVDAATGWVFEPGSVHKAIVVAAALEEGLVKPDTTITVGPEIRKGDQRFKDTTRLPNGTPLSLAGILAYSSNVGTIELAEMLGPQKLYEYQRRFGLGEATGVGVPGESPGLLLAPQDWSGSSHGSVPIGHSVSATALQMAAVYAAIANDGVWVAPRLVRATVKPDGTRVPAAAGASRRVISAANAATLRQLLEAVVTVPGATGRAAAVPNYRVAGKTGTGARLENGQRLPGEVGSFIGIAPADAPRYVIAVVAHAPGTAAHSAAGPAFREMMEFTLQHYRVPPTGTQPPKFIVRP